MLYAPVNWTPCAPWSPLLAVENGKGVLFTNPFPPLRPAIKVKLATLLPGNAKTVEAVCAFPPAAVVVGT